LESPEDDPLNLSRSEPVVRWCKHCEAHKPDRTHHCSVSGRCILRFDHFCPWVNNAVGFNNHKFFILFCFWCAVLCVVAFALILLTLFERAGWDFLKWTVIDVQLAVVLFITFLFALTLLSFVGLHVYLLRKNQTTLEQMKDDHRWDRGSAGANIREIFGTNRKTWLLPVAPTGAGTGLEFATRH
jgi:palmitoyltransferase